MGTVVPSSISTIESLILMASTYGATEVTIQEYGSCKFLRNQKYNYLRALTNLYHEVDSSNYGNRFSTRTTNVWFIFQFLDLMPHHWQNIAKSYKTGTGAIIEDENKSFRGSGRVSSISVISLVTLSKN